MARAHPHHHPHFDGVAASVGGIMLFLFMAMLAMLHDCVSVVTDFSHVHH
jgi:hypothetical protein